MRISEDKIKQAIIHPDDEVRLMALEYFTESFSQDPTLMPLVIQSIEKYDKQNAYIFIGAASNIKQSEETISWVLDGLYKDINLIERNKINYYFNLSRVLSESDLSLLLKHQTEIMEAPYLLPEFRKEILQFLDMYLWGSDKCWKALEDFCEKEKNKQYVNDIDLTYTYNLIKALSSQGENLTDKIISLLDIEIDNYVGNSMKWMEPFVVILAGEMQLKQAIPYIVKKLHIDGDYCNERCVEALIKINTDAVVQAIFNDFMDAEWHFRLYASSCLEHIHTDLTVDRCLDLAKKERDLTIKTYLARALISQFSYKAMDFVYAMVKKGRWDGVYCDLKEDFLTACIIMGKTYPEHDKWEAEVAPKRQKDKSIIEDIINGRIVSPDYAENLHHTLGRKVGRNEPCPCGSGKKYKKCCGR